MLCLENLFRKWAFISLLQLLLIQNICANINNNTLSCLVGIKITRSSELSYGSLITERAVLTSAEIVINAHKNNLTIIKNCAFFSLQYSTMDICLERKVLNINLLKNLNADNNFQDSVAVLILESPFYQDNIIKLVDHFDHVDENKCFFINWDYVKIQKTVVINTITSLDKVSLLEKKTDIKILITDRLRNVDTDYAISKVKINLLQNQNEYEMILDKSKDFSGNPLICALKTNSSSYVQIGVAAGYLTQKYVDNVKFIIGRYYVDVRNQHSQLMNLAEIKNNSSL